MPPLRLIRPTAFALTLLAVAGCSAISSIDAASQPLNTFELSPLAPGSVPASSTRRHLEVALPTATGALTSDRIIVKTTPFEVQSLPDARWVNDTTELVQLLLVRSAANTGRFALVTASGGGPAPDYELLSDLRAFQVETQGDAQVVVVETTLTLLRDTDGTVVASRRFSDTTPVPTLAAADVIAAFDAAMTQQLQDILRWLVRSSG